MYNTVPANGWPQLKELEEMTSGAALDARLDAIEAWIESVDPTESGDADNA